MACQNRRLLMNRLWLNIGIVICPLIFTVGLFSDRVLFKPAQAFWGTSSKLHFNSWSITGENSISHAGVRQTPVAVVSAASFEATAIAPDSIMAAFGTQLATSTVIATVTPLPTELGGTTVEVNGSRAGLFFVSPSQINFAVPANTVPGNADVVVRAGNGVVSNGKMQVRSVAPAIFSANSDGKGVPAAILVRVKPDGQQIFESLALCGGSPFVCTPKPIDLGPEGEVAVLALFLSGIRRAPDPNGDGNLNDSIRVLIGDNEVVPLYAGRQGNFVGLDQVNAVIPRSLIGRGRINVSITGSGIPTSNRVEIEIAPPVDVATLLYPGPTTVVGDSQGGLISCDLNNDGRLDIVSANQNRTISILLGRGNGSYQPQRSISLSLASISIAAADFNGDARLDLVTSHWGGNLSLLFGNGDGSFQPVRIFAAESLNILSAAASDINLDGKTDLILIVWPSSLDGFFGISVLLGNGNGTFQPKQRAATGRSPRSLAITDLNADRYPDIVTANTENASPRDVSILLSNRDGSFRAPQLVKPSAYTYSVSVADVNGDSQPDLITTGFEFVANPTLNFYVSLGNGDGTFRRMDNGVQIASRPVAGIVLADINRDSRLDVVSFNLESPDVSLWLGNGDGTFRLYQLIPVGGIDVEKIILAFKANSDEIPDILLHRQDDVVIMLGRGDGSFYSQQFLPVAKSPSSIASGDLNRDGHIDVIITNSESNEVSILLGKGNANFQPQQQYATGNGPVAIAIGDLNGDGRLDIATANERSQDISVLIGIGDGSFTLSENLSSIGVPHDVILGDFNNDGRLDLVSANGRSVEEGEISFRLGKGNGFFQPALHFRVKNGAKSLTIGDVNGDGRLDLATGGFGTYSVSVFIGNGNGTFQPQRQYSAGDDTEIAVLADFNRDGFLDLGAITGFYYRLAVFLNKGDGTFGPLRAFEVGDACTAVATGDLNGDGIPDVVTANEYSQRISVLIGKGDGTFHTGQTFAVGGAPAKILLVDLNGDGRMDILTPNRQSRDLSILIHQ